MTRLLDKAIAKVRGLAKRDQDAMAARSLAAADASIFPIDPETRTLIREGLAQAERGEFVDDDVMADVDKRHSL